jgi:hypothetical protein
MNDQCLRQADIILSKCGRPMAPPGRAVVPLTFGILIQGQCANNATTTLTQEVPGSMPFLLRAIQSTFPGSLYFNIQLPNGHYLLNNECDVSQLAGIGSYRYLEKELECPPGSRIVVTLDTSVTSPGSTQTIQLLFEGYYRALVHGGGGVNTNLVSRLPRYWGGQENQNILSPGWMGGEGPKTPKGCRDERFTYSALGNRVIGNSTPYNGVPIPGFTIPVATGPYSGIDEIDIEETSDFAMRRLLFNVSATSTAAGTFLVRARAGSGYALMDDFFDVARLINGSPIAHDWNLKRGEKVFFDIQLVDFSGSGNLTLQTFMDGVRRRRAV